LTRIDGADCNKCDKPKADVDTKSPPVDTEPDHVKTRSPSCLPVPLVASRCLSADADQSSLHRHSPALRDNTSQMSAGRCADACGTTTSSRQRPAPPPCLRVPSYVCSGLDAAVARQSTNKRRRPLATTQRQVMSVVTDDRHRHVLVDTAQSLSAKTHGNVTMTSATASETNTEQHHPVETQVDCEEGRCSVSEQKSMKDLTRKRKSLYYPEAEVVKADASDGDGWAPIDKDVLVGIVERLSVSCLQPSSSASSSSSTSSLSSVQTGGAVNAATSWTMSQSEFRQPLMLSVTPTRRADAAASTDEFGAGSVIARKRAAPASLPLSSTLCRLGSVPRPHKTQRLTACSPAVTLRCAVAGRRKSSSERRVQVRDTWNVPADKSPLSAGVSRKSSTSESSVRGAAMSSSLSPTSRQVWAPLEKSVVLSVIDHILVDSDVERSLDDCSGTGRRREQLSRRRWLQPPTLRAITAPASPAPTSRDLGTTDDPPCTTAAEASFKWKSNILRRIRKEQTVVAASSGRWLDVASGAVAATGS